MYILVHLDKHKLLPDLQSAYRAHHSTDTAVLKVLPDILVVIDKGDLAMLVMLDLSAAFDSADQSILLRRQHISYGLDSTVLQLFSSYLDHRTQFVRCASSTSTPSFIECGVPQGSVLGPILFLLYTADLVNLVKFYDLNPHLYADDTQIYGFSQPVTTDELQSLQSLMVALVLSRLDYGSIVLDGLPKQLLDRLQPVQNAAARLVFAARRKDHITPLLHSLHWLRVAERITFRLAVLTYRCLHGSAPEYLTSLLQCVSDVHTRQRLRSASSSDLMVPRHGQFAPVSSSIHMECST